MANLDQLSDNHLQLMSSYDDVESLVNERSAAHPAMGNMANQDKWVLIPVKNVKDVIDNTLIITTKVRVSTSVPLAFHRQNLPYTKPLG